MRRAARVLAALAGLLLAAFVILRVPDTDPAEMRAKYGAAPSQFIEIASGRTVFDPDKVHVRDEGPRDAPVIVLLHGSNADLHTWQPWVDRLKRDWRVIRYDQRGHGLTGPLALDNYSRDAFGRDLSLVLHALGVERFVLAGNSMGGGIALGYAVAYAGKIHPDAPANGGLLGLVLIDATGAPQIEKAEGNIGFTLARTPGVSQVLSAMVPRSLIERSLRQSVSNQAIVTEAAVNRYWELLRYPGNRAATSKRFATRDVPFDPRQLAELNLPTLIIWGAEDRLIPVSSGRWLARHIPGARLEVLPGIGHLPMEEAPDATVRALRAWAEQAELELAPPNLPAD